MTSINLTVVIKSLGLGGAERLLVDAMPYVDRKRFHYRYAYVTPWKRTLVPTIEAQGFDVSCLGLGTASEIPDPASTYVPARSIQALALLPTALKRLNRLIRESHCDLLQADLPMAGILARIAGKQMGIPVAYTEHNLQERYHPLTRWANRVSYAWNDVVFAVSEEVAASIRRNGLAGKWDNRQSMKVLPNGVPVDTIRDEASGLDDLRRELAIVDGRPIVGTVSVLRPEKRLMDWLEVAQKVARAHDDAMFLIVGDGPDMPAVRARARELDIADKVFLTGFRNDGRRLMALMDVFLMTSAYEGMPIAMLEAMALGIPVVATAVGGIPEVIDSGGEGMLAPAGDTGRLAACISALLANPAAAAAMGCAGFHKVNHRFHTRDRVAAMESAYIEMLSQ